MTWISARINVVSICAGTCYYKDKAGKISSKGYRPVALASVISKLVEVIMLDRIEMYMNTNPNQFGFKRKHGTDQCIYVLNEIIDSYSVFVCFLDASKAF